jgi:hypothetical protein
MFSAAASQPSSSALYRCGAGGDSGSAREVVGAIKSFFCGTEALSVDPPQGPEDGMLAEALTDAGFREGP